MALLPAKALGLGDGDALQADLLQRLFHFVELEWFDDRFDLLHCVSSPLALPTRAGRDLPCFRLAGSMPSTLQAGNRLRIRCLIAAPWHIGKTTEHKLSKLPTLWSSEPMSSWHMQKYHSHGKANGKASAKASARDASGQ